METINVNFVVTTIQPFFFFPIWLNLLGSFGVVHDSTMSRSTWKYIIWLIHVAMRCKFLRIVCGDFAIGYVYNNLSHQTLLGVFLPFIIRHQVWCLEISHILAIIRLNWSMLWKMLRPYWFSIIKKNKVQTKVQLSYIFCEKLSHVYIGNNEFACSLIVSYSSEDTKFYNENFHKQKLIFFWRFGDLIAMVFIYFHGAFF
jgi:hypothetical protein